MSEKKKTLPPKEKRPKKDEIIEIEPDETPAEKPPAQIIRFD